MTQDQIQAWVDNAKWTFLGRGSFNEVGRSKSQFTIGDFTGEWVYKRQSIRTAFSESSRAVRKWNTINPDFPAYQVKNGWIAPYVGDQQASDDQIFLKMVDIYLRTRHIIVDGHVKRNFLYYKDQVLCVDFDLAIHRKSVVSRRLPRDLKDFEDGFEEYIAKGFGQTVATIKNLFYLERCLDDLPNECIRPRVIASLTSFRESDKTLTLDMLGLLTKIDHMDPLNELDPQFLTPDFIEPLLTIEKNSPITDKVQLFKEIYSILMSRYNPAILVMRNNLPALTFCIAQNPELLKWIDPQGYNLLHLAANYDRLEICDYLIKQGMPIPELTPVVPFMSAVDIAITSLHFDVAKILFDADTRRPYQLNLNPHHLFYAAWHGFLVEVKKIIEWKPEWIKAYDKWNQNALLWASMNGQNSVVQYLLRKGANSRQPTLDHPNQALCHSSPLDWAIRNKHTETALILDKAGAIANHRHTTMNNKDLPGLIAGNELQNIKILLANNKSLVRVFDKSGYTPLIHAVYYGNLRIVTLLIQVGADHAIRAKPSKESHLTFQNMSPLEVAIVRNHVNIASWLFKLDPQIILINDRRRALFFAARNGLLSLLKKLVESNPLLIHEQDDNNKTALTHAAAKGHLPVVDYLIVKGAELNPLTKRATGAFYSKCIGKGFTPLDWAIHNENEAVISRLVHAGALPHFYSAEERIVSPKPAKLLFFQPPADSTSDHSGAACSSNQSGIVNVTQRF